MKFLLIFSAVAIVVTFSAPADQPFELIQDRIDKILQGMVLQTDIIFTLFTTSPDDGQQLFLNDAGVSLSLSKFNPANPTRFITHGWKNDGTSEFATVIKEAFVDRGGYNVIVVDWGKDAYNNNFFEASLSVESVGLHIATMIKLLRQKYPQLTNITLIGHSLGAHASGYAGSFLGKDQVDNIVALEPSNPFLGPTPLLIKLLCKSDAKNVQVIHTNPGMLGRLDPCGHSDFYLNFPIIKQPGCSNDLVGNCAHGRSALVYAESIRAKGSNFVARKCGDFNRMAVFGKCVSNDANSYMGGEPLDKNAAGIYHLSTNDTSPFAKGADGCI